MKKAVKSFCAILAIALVVAACGTKSNNATESSATGQDTTVTEPAPAQQDTAATTQPGDTTQHQ